MSAVEGEVGVGGLAGGAGVSFDIVKDSLAGSFGTIAAVMLPVLAVALFVVVVVAGVWLVRRVLWEVRQAHAVPDPRPLVDPLASDVLGEW